MKWIRYGFTGLLSLGVLLFLVTTVMASAPPHVQLVEFDNPGPAILTRLVEQGWDIWAITPTRVTAQLTVDQMIALQAMEIALQPVGRPLQVYARFPACYRTYAEAETQVQAWAAAYPNLVTLVDAGPSWETAQGVANRRLWTLRITAGEDSAPKPKILIVALHHAREIITPEIALNLAELLLTGYEMDADITWLIDHREIWIMPFANPDGHIFAEKSVDWRKNTNYTQSTCIEGRPPNSFGVDLNRNYDYKWGTVGASSDPCNLTYRGQSGFSEPETQAIRDLIQIQKFDIVLSLHSYSDLILYPWGYTNAPAPDDAGLSDIAAVMASFNGYIPEPASALYLTSGDTCDWAYGAMGIPCFTFEIGSAQEGYFWPNCTHAQEQWNENRDVLLHAIKLAEEPYRLARAPVVRDLQIRFRGRFMTVDVVLDQSATGVNPPAGGEVFIDEIGAVGTGITLLGDVAIVNSPVETMTATVDLVGLEDRHVVYALGTTDAGAHGPPRALYFRPCYDVTEDARVDVKDVMQVASHWSREAGDPEFDMALDFDADDQIDVQDITRIALQWDSDCNDL